MHRPLLSVLVCALLMISAPSASSAQEGAFLDPGAAQLLARARSFRDAVDSTILSYSGTVRTRVAAGLRMPLKDRTLYRRESSARFRWSRDGASVIKVTGFREQTPSGVTTPSFGNSGAVDDLFDPTQDRIYFGLTDRVDDGDNEVWIEHPLIAGAEKHYRYRSGDTLTIRMQDGRSIRAIELQVLPRENSGHLVSGSLWIDASNGTVVQAVYRLARPMDIASEVLDEDDREGMKYVPGMFKPMTFDISLVAMEYALYDFKYWMPRVTRLEGSLRAGIINTPASYEISYDIDDVVSATPETVAAEKQIADSVAESWADSAHYMGVRRKVKGHEVRVVMPEDSLSLITSSELPPPIWKTSPEFIPEKQLEDLYDRLKRVAPVLPFSTEGARFTWGTGASDLMRYNRIESLSIGARVSYATPFADAAATVRLGAADLHPNADVTIVRSTPRRTVSFTIAHELQTMDPQTDPFGMGNSASAFLLGRDDGEYYRSTGARLTFAPAAERRAHSDLTFFAQHDDAVKVHTNVSLRSIWDGDFRFRPNTVAAETELYGAAMSFRPWWGTDPFRAQAGLDGLIEGATGGFRYGRARLTARTAIPLGSTFRAALEAGAGTSTGRVPPQRLWYLGGAATLRGYDGATVAGTSFGRARAELERSFGWGGLTVFSDAGWAGDRTAFDDRDIIYSAGVGSSLLDGLLRADVAHQLSRGHHTRLELYVDAIL